MKHYNKRKNRQHDEIFKSFFRQRIRILISAWKQYILGTIEVSDFPQEKIERILWWSDRSLPSESMKRLWHRKQLFAEPFPPSYLVGLHFRRVAKETYGTPGKHLLW